MRGRQFEHRRHVFAGDLVQHPQRNDRTLQLPEVIEAPDHERKTLRLSYQLVDRQRLSGEKDEGLIVCIMWARELVSAEPVAALIRLAGHKAFAPTIKGNGPGDPKSVGLTEAIAS